MFAKLFLPRITRIVICAIIMLLCKISIAGTAYTAPALKKLQWSFDGMSGKFDIQSIQRGFQVYKEVCSACHGITRIAFRNLQEIGFSEAEVKEVANDYSFNDIDADGEVVQMPGIPSDYFPSSFPNPAAAKAVNNGKEPPDLSLMIKARKDGANYTYSLLTGYQDAPEGFVVSEGGTYNPYFIDGEGVIAMPPPLNMAGQVKYSDGTEATIDQMSRDVVNFLQWCAEPEMEVRKNLGLKVLIFIVFFTIFFYFAKRNIWRKIK